MQEGETLKVYSDRYWKMFNDMEGNFDAMALDTFKLGLPTNYGLRTTLSGKPVTNMRQLMDCIEKYKIVEEDQQQGKGKDKVIPQERRNFRLDHYNNNKPRKDFTGQSGSTNLQAINTVFKEPVHQVLEKVKNEPFFKWSNKMVGNPERCNHNLCCQYHQDHGYTTEDCRSMWDHLDQLVREVTFRNGGYDVKRVMVDQGSAVEIMDPDLYRGLNLTPDDLTTYSSPLVSFEGRIVTPKGQIRLSV
ncbi:uncharacterized protein LOC136070753 [Quercus suber]|uniref:uncharacterized protein LOC136070753 n=1 Tax=Quercus suber TaxID=58331 RepID=UPI0032DE5943